MADTKKATAEVAEEVVEATTEEKVEKKPEPKKEFKPSDPQPFVSKKKDKVAGATPNRGPAEIRHVDTRTSNVNIDKYNEKSLTFIAQSPISRNNFIDCVNKKEKIPSSFGHWRHWWCCLALCVCWQVCPI